MLHSESKSARKPQSTQIDECKLIECKDLKKGRLYWLTGEYWPHGGKPVTLKKFFPAKEQWSGERGQGAIVKTNDGTLISIGPRDSLFAEDPCFIQA